MLDQEIKQIVTDGLSVTADEVVKWVALKYSPGDVFPEKELAEWALENGYVQEPTP